MHISCSSTSVLCSLSYALLAQTAFLPASISSVNETLLGLPIVNLSGPLFTTGAAPIPVSSRNIVLAFIAQGQPIPEDEVKATLVNADSAIADLAREYPTQRITNDRFEYRRPDGNMLISIRTIQGEEITWKELARVLQGLYRYMTAGIGTETTHYQALEFEIEASSQKKPNIGYGLVWYFNPTDTEVQKRGTLDLPISLIDEGTLQLPNLTFPQSSSETLRRPSNATLASAGANNVQENEVFPIPKTPLSLSFYNFGPSIPEQSVKATIQGAQAKVRPFLSGRTEMNPIENDGFRWVLPLSREAGIPVAITVFTYHGQEITWRQLFDVLFGLYAFTTTFGTDLEKTHYQVLGFRIVDHRAKNLGVGNIAYFVSGIGQPAYGVQSINNGSILQRPSAANISSLNPVVVSSSIVYPVTSTDIVLTFTFLGDTPIPPLEINGAISGAQQKIAHAVVQNPDVPLPAKFGDISTSGRVSTNIFVYGGKFITWKELDHILRGMHDFCQDHQDHDRVLVFEIDINRPGRGRVGFGTLLYVQSNPINVEKRALVAHDMTLETPPRTTKSQSNLTAIAIPMPYPIPGTPITLTFSAFGTPIPSINVNAAFTSALRKIQIHTTHHPNTPIPNDRWECRGAISNVWIMIVACDGNPISWQELRSVVVALFRFMTEAGEHRCREVVFDIDKVREVTTGYGSVMYIPDE